MSDHSLHFSAPAPGPARHRVTRACDNCKSRRAKCKAILVEEGFAARCALCEEQGLECTFTAPVKRRGPQPGFRQAKEGRQGRSRSPYQRAQDGFAPYPSMPPRQEKRVVDKDPLYGLPPDLVDELLAIYFTHVHNVWPLIYKPLFNPHTTSRHLLLAILAIASCLAQTPHPSVNPFDSERLFRMAEQSMKEYNDRDECRIDTIQALVLMSLRQTGNGHKQSAFIYAGRACVGALSIGLNLKPTRSVSPMDAEVRSRVYWNVYILDKGLAEETGRPPLLPYNRSSTPLPSINETDELETWPPMAMSSAPPPVSVRHIVPRRGYIMSCFVWACRLAMLFEDIINLHVQIPEKMDAWDEQFEARRSAKKEQEVEEVATQLDIWRKSLPPHLEVDTNPSVSPLPHHVVTLAWYQTARILLFSRFTRRRYPNISPFTPSGSLVDQSHAICAQAAQDTIDMFSHADRHKLLTSVSSDVIHMLSMTTLFEAFDSTNPDHGIAHRAKLNFAQCCIWLRDFSASWPSASAHKLFFEGLIQGGLRLTSLDDEAHDLIDSGTPGVSGGLRHFGRNLSIIDPNNQVPQDVQEPAQLLDSFNTGNNQLGDIFQLPQIYWNHLTNPDPYVDPSAPAAMPATSNSPPWTGAEGLLTEEPWTGIDFGPPASHPVQTHEEMSNHASGRAEGLEMGMAPDQSAIYAALMSYMVQAARVQ